MGEATLVKKRFVGIDIIKVVSIFFVVVIHFSLNSAYYKTPLGGINMFLQSFIRWIVLCGVPLFIMCTGYLSCKKEATWSYYKKIFSVLIPYLIISVICIVVKHITGIEQFELKKSIYSIFNFAADNYSWYVNMYIGLFLLAPIFNYCINNTTKKQLIGIICALTIAISLPSTFNQILMYEYSGHFFRFPEWWQGVYPILFYFLGAYIAKYQIKIKLYFSIPIIVILPVVQTLLQFKYANQAEFDNWVFYNNGSLYFVIESFLIFALLYSIEGKCKGVNAVMKTLSNATLEIYLFSYLTDASIYYYFKNKAGFPDSMNQQAFFIKYFIVTIFFSFALSAVIAVAFNCVYGFAEKGVGKLYKKRKN